MTIHSTEDAISIANRLMMDGNLQAAIDSLQPLIKEPPENKAAHFRLLMTYGTLLTKAIFFVNGEATTARTVLEQARQTAITQDDETGQGAALDQIGMTYYYEQLGQTERDFSTAQDYFRRAYTLLEAGQVNHLLSDVVFHQGLVAQFSGDLETAHRHFERASALAADHPIKKSYAERHLGFLAGMADDWETAGTHLAASLELRKNAGYQIGLAFSHLSMGDVAMHSEQYREALEHYQMALEFAEKLDNKRAEALSWLSMGQAYATTGEVEQARHAYELAQTFARNIGHTIAEELASKGLAELEQNE